MLSPVHAVVHPHYVGLMAGPPSCPGEARQVLDRGPAVPFERLVLHREPVYRPSANARTPVSGLAR